MAWETESNPFSYEGLITAAEFGNHEKFVDPETGDARTLLLLTVATSMGDERTEILTTGNGWEINDGGKSTSHPTRSKFNDQSAIGQWIDRIIAIDGVLEALSSRGDEFHADSYVGLEFEWESEPVMNRDGTPKTYTASDGEIKQSTRMVPTRLISAEGASATATPAKATAKKAAPKPPAKEDVEDAPYKPKTAMLKKLESIAKGAADHDEFVDAAYKAHEDELGADKELESYVLDAANWATTIGV